MCFTIFHVIIGSVVYHHHYIIIITNILYTIPPSLLILLFNIIIIIEIINLLFYYLYYNDVPVNCLDDASEALVPIHTFRVSQGPVGDERLLGGSEIFTFLWLFACL